MDFLSLRPAPLVVTVSHIIQTQGCVSPVTPDIAKIIIASSWNSQGRHGRAYLSSATLSSSSRNRGFADCSWLGTFADYPSYSVASLAPNTSLIGYGATEAAIVDQWVAFVDSEITRYNTLILQLVKGVINPYNKPVSYLRSSSLVPLNSLSRSIPSSRTASHLLSPYSKSILLLVLSLRLSE